MPSQRFKGFTVLKGLEGLERLTVESEEGEVPHLRWSQAPPLPWPRPGSADFSEGLKPPTRTSCSFLSRGSISLGPPAEVTLQCPRAKRSAPDGLGPQESPRSRLPVADQQEKGETFRLVRDF